MAENDYNINIAVGASFDPTGVNEANANLEKLKQTADSVPSPGGSPAEPSPQDGGKVDTSGEEALAKAKENTAEATGMATEASKELSAARTDGQKATTKAATAEKTLATERKATADATTTAADAEQKAADEATAAAQQKQQASAQNTEALSKEQQEIEALKAQMALEAKGRAGLIKELERLGKARARAAKAGDVQAFKQLEAQMTKTRAAFERMNQGLEISRLGMMGQMQVAMGAMGAIQSLGNEVKSGSVSLMGMANAVYALGAAIKAGMGPVGWIMMAIQGLSMAWDWYANKQEEAAKAERERMEAEHEALMQHWEEVEKFANMDRENTLTRWTKDLDALQKKRAEFNEQQVAAAKREDMLASATDARRAIAAQAVYDQEAARVELARTLGEISEEEARHRISAAEAVLAAEKQAIEEAEIHRTRLRAAQASIRAKREADELAGEIESKFGQLDEVLRVKLPTSAEWEALQLKLVEGLGSMEERVQSSHIHDKIRELEKMLAAMGIAWQGSDAELIKWVENMREARESSEARVRELRATEEACKLEAAEARQRLETSRAAAAADAQAREARRQQETARQQQAALAISWQEVQRGTLEQQAVWLEATAAQFAQGSEAAKKWNDVLRSVKLRQISEGLNKLGETFKVTGNYAEADNRTQAQIHAADEKALRQRRAALERLKSAPDVDAATLAAINAKITETDAQMLGLRNAMHQSARQAQRTLAGLTPLAQQAQNKGAQGALKRAEKAFVRLAQQAERQAARGDSKALERTQEALRRNALQQEKLTGYTGKAAAAQREVENNLRHLIQGTAAQDKGLTARQRTENAIRLQLEGRRRYTARTTQADRRTAAAAEKEARSREKNAQLATTTATQQNNTSQQVATLTQQLTTATTSLSELKTAVTSLEGTITQLATMASAAASAATTTATSATGKLAGLQNQVNSLKNAIRLLRRA